MLPVLERYLRSRISCDDLIHHLNNIEVTVTGVTNDSDIRRHIKELRIQISSLTELIDKKLYRIRSQIDETINPDFSCEILQSLLED